MRSWHKCFCNEILEKPLKVVLQTRNHHNFEKKQQWKASRRNNDTDVGTFAMLKYGRNEKMAFCVFIGHERQKLFVGIIIFKRRVRPSNFVVVTFLLLCMRGLLEGVFSRITTL